MLVEKKEIDFYMGMLSDEIIYTILKEYGFDDTWIVIPFININGTALAINRRSETARKAVILYRGELYVLKEVPWYCSEEKFVRYEIEYQTRLGIHEIPIPFILKTMKGAPYVKLIHEGANKIFFLQKYISGASWNGSLEKLQNAAAALAKLHCVSERISSGLINEYKPPKATVFDLAEKMLEVAEQVIYERENRIEIRAMNAIKNYFRISKERISTYESSAMKKCYNSIAYPIHGDFNPWNIIFSKDHDDVIGIIDFDNSVIDNPVHDFAEALLDFCFFTYKCQSTIFKGIPTCLNKNNVKLFIENYIKYNKRAFLEFLPYLKEVIGAITIELTSLAVARGDYSYEEYELLNEMNTIPGDEIEKMIIDMYRDL